MQLIGVTGKSGAGKTTFSNMLAENSNVGVIHIDDLLRKIKLRYFKFFMNKDKNGEKTKVNRKMKMLIYKNRTLFDLFMRARAKLLKKYINTQIQNMQEAKKNIIIIDDIFIKYLNVYNGLSKIFIVERPYVERKEALKQRDNLTLEEIVASDMAHFKGNYGEISGRNDVQKITNKGTIEEFKEKTNQIYKDFFIPEGCTYKDNLKINTEMSYSMDNKEVVDNNSEKTKEAYDDLDITI